MKKFIRLLCVLCVGVGMAPRYAAAGLVAPGLWAAGGVSVLLFVGDRILSRKISKLELKKNAYEQMRLRALFSGGKERVQFLQEQVDGINYKIEDYRDLRAAARLGAAGAVATVVGIAVQNWRAGRQGAKPSVIPLSQPGPSLVPSVTPPVTPLPSLSPSRQANDVEEFTKIDGDAASGIAYVDMKKELDTFSWGDDVNQWKKNNEERIGMLTDSDQKSLNVLLSKIDEKVHQSSDIHKLVSMRIGNSAEAVGADIMDPIKKSQQAFDEAFSKGTQEAIASYLRDSAIVTVFLDGQLVVGIVTDDFWKACVVMGFCCVDPIDVYAAHLGAAIYLGDAERVRTILRAHPYKINSGLTEIGKFTPIEYAFMLYFKRNSEERGCLSDVITVLLNANPNLHQKNEFGISVLDILRRAKDILSAGSGKLFPHPLYNGLDKTVDAAQKDFERIKNEDDVFWWIVRYGDLVHYDNERMKECYNKVVTKASMPQWVAKNIAYAQLWSAVRLNSDAIIQQPDLLWQMASGIETFDNLNSYWKTKLYCAWLSLEAVKHRIELSHAGCVGTDNFAYKFAEACDFLKIKDRSVRGVEEACKELSKDNPLEFFIDAATPEAATERMKLALQALDSPDLNLAEWSQQYSDVWSLNGLTQEEEQQKDILRQAYQHKKAEAAAKTLDPDKAHEKFDHIDRNLFSRLAECSDHESTVKKPWIPLDTLRAEGALLNPADDGDCAPRALLAGELYMEHAKCLNGSIVPCFHFERACNVLLQPRPDKAQDGEEYQVDSTKLRSDLSRYFVTQIKSRPQNEWTDGQWMCNVSTSYFGGGELEEKEFTPTDQAVTDAADRFQKSMWDDQRWFDTNVLKVYADMKKIPVFVWQEFPHHALVLMETLLPADYQKPNDWKPDSTHVIHLLLTRADDKPITATNEFLHYKLMILPDGPLTSGWKSS